MGAAIILITKLAVQTDIVLVWIGGVSVSERNSLPGPFSKHPAGLQVAKIRGILPAAFLIMLSLPIGE